MSDRGKSTDTALRRLLGRVRRHVLGDGLLGLGATAVPALLAAWWAAGGIDEKGGIISWGLSLSTLALLGLLIWHFLVRRLRLYRNTQDLVAAAEHRGSFGNVLVAAEEASRRPERWANGDPVVRELARRLDERARAVLELLTPSQIQPVNHTMVRRWTFAGGLAAAVIFAVVYPAQLARGIANLADPRGATSAKPVRGLYAEPKAPWVAIGSDVTLSAADFAGGPGRTLCEVQFGGGGWNVVEAQPFAVHGDVAGTPAVFRRWQADLADVREDFRWRFRREDLVTAVGEVTVRPPPLLARMAARLEPPAYTGIAAHDVERLPMYSEAPMGSRLVLSGTVSHEVSAAWLALGEGDSVAMTVDADRIRVDMALDGNLVFAVGLRDPWGLGNPDPLRYEIAALPDQSPAVTLERPSDDGVLPLDGRIQLLVAAADDFGLRTLSLLARTGTLGLDFDPDTGAGGDQWHTSTFGPAASGAWSKVATSAGTLLLRAQRTDDRNSSLRVSCSLEIDASEMNMVPGDALDLVVEARDNRVPGLGNATRTRVLRLVLPSAADVLMAQAESNDQSRNELEEARRRSRELGADLERLARELLKNPNPDWARRQEMEAAIQRQKELQDELARVAAQLEREIAKLMQNKLTSEAQLERAGQMSELLAQDSENKLRQLLEDVEKAAGQVAPDEIARAMGEIERQQQDQARRLDAALSLMKRMSEEQEMAGLTAMLEKMMRQQQELADLSRSAAQEKDENTEQVPDAAELARRQEALARELEQLREKLEQALTEDKEQTGGKDQAESSKRQEALREALERMEQQQSKQNMESASKKLMESDPSEAAQMQQQALRDLGSLYSVLLQSQQAMQMAMKMEQVSSLRSLASDLLALSARQEDLGTRIPSQLQDVRTAELARQQHRLQTAASGVRERLSALMEEAPNRILRLIEKLDTLIEEMGGGVRALGDNQAAVARERSGQSLAEANRIVIGLLTEAQMSGGGGGSGSKQEDSASEQLQEMARQQAKLNGATDELRQMLADRGISQQTRSQMQRLGEEQAALGREMGRLAEQERERPAGEGERLLGDLRELGQQMERVGGDLGGGHVDDQTLQRQDRILGRLLDARNSVRQRDFSVRRESRTALRPDGVQDGPSGSPDGSRTDPFRQRYQRMNDAPLEYRELIRRYFAALDSLGQLDPESGRRDEGILP